MEVETQLSDIKKSITNLTIMVEKHVSYSDGLKLPERMGTIEYDVGKVKREKASWHGLYLFAGFLLLIVGIASGAVWAVAKGIE